MDEALVEKIIQKSASQAVIGIRFKNPDDCHTAHRVAIEAARAAIQAVQEAQPVMGWFYINPDTGVEFSEQHPVESGEVPDAADIRPATAEALRDELFSAWERLKDSANKADAWDACVRSNQKGYDRGFAAGAEAMREAAASAVHLLDGYADSDLTEYGRDCKQHAARIRALPLPPSKGGQNG